VLLIGAALTSFWFAVGRHRSISESPNDWAQFGDFVGGVVGTIVSAATLALVAVTILIQLRVMNLAKRQLEDSQKELALTRDEMKQSNSALRQQTFESTFFRMLEQFRQYTQSISYGSASGIDAFTSMRIDLKGRYDSLHQIEDRKARSLSAYKEFYRDTAKWLGPYFRSLYHLHKLVHQSGLKDEARARYASLVRAQLSQYELVILFYNLLDERGLGLLPYVNYYGVLKHLDRGDLLDKQHQLLEFAAAEPAFHDYDWRLVHDVRADPDIGR